MCYKHKTEYKASSLKLKKYYYLREYGDILKYVAVLNWVQCQKYNTVEITIISSKCCR